MEVYIFILGLLFGSFFLVLGIRLPKGENVLTSRSHCDNCNKVLKWYELIPLLSYIFQLGKCKNCKNKISILNPLVELATAILFLIGFKLYGLSYLYGIYLVIVSLMIIVFVSDFIYMIINDSPLIISAVLLLVFNYLIGGFHLFAIRLLSGVLLFVFMYLVGYIGSIVFKKEALGGADIKLAGIIGLAVGFKLGLCVFILSVFLALPYSVASIKLSKTNEVPYGPFLVGALFIVFVFSNKFINLLNFLGT